MELIQKRKPLIGRHDDIDPSHELRDVLRYGILSHGKGTHQLQNDLVTLRLGQTRHDLDKVFPCLQLVGDTRTELQQVQQVRGILVYLQKIRLPEHFLLGEESRERAASYLSDLAMVDFTADEMQMTVILHWVNSKNP